MKMPYGKQGGHVKAPVHGAMVGKKPGGKVVGAGMVKQGSTPKSVGSGGQKLK
jgi:hypothetical protein